MNEHEHQSFDGGSECLGCLLEEDAARALPPECPGCGRIMSNREAAEQGECNDCHPGGAFDPYA